MKFGRWKTKRESGSETSASTVPYKGRRGDEPKESREDAVERVVQQRELANFWGYDGTAQVPIDREDIRRQLY